MNYQNQEAKDFYSKRNPSHAGDKDRRFLHDCHDYDTALKFITGMMGFLNNGMWLDSLWGWRDHEEGYAQASRRALMAYMNGVYWGAPTEEQITIRHEMVEAQKQESPLYQFDPELGF